MTLDRRISAFKSMRLFVLAESRVRPKARSNGRARSAIGTQGVFVRDVDESCPRLGLRRSLQGEGKSRSQLHRSINNATPKRAGEIEFVHSFEVSPFIRR
jgi:hypothetical protein